MHELIKQTHPHWHDMLNEALSHVSDDYLNWLDAHDDWLPGPANVFAAFKTPLSNIRYVLMGESPYPRRESANGYAFWDASVGSLWSETGLSKPVNRATSLRNWIKMLLHARGDLSNDFSQPAITQLDKAHYVQTAEALFNRMLQSGFLLLNASLVYSEGKVNYHAKQWRPFIHSVLLQLAQSRPETNLILFGRIANELPETRLLPSLIAEHPYNISFITNPDVLAFFKPLDLLSHDETINS